MVRQYLLFEVAESKYAIKTSDVVKIVSMQPITRIPNTPHDIRGLMNLRGRIVVVVDTRKRWHHEMKEDDLKTSIIVTHFNEKWIGWIVDAIDKIMYFEEEDFLPIAWGKIVQEIPLVDKVICYQQELVGVVSEINLMGK